MSTRRAQSILVCEMVVSAYMKRQTLTFRLSHRRCAIDRLGVGWLFLSLFPFLLPLKAALPSPPSELPIEREDRVDHLP